MNQMKELSKCIGNVIEFMNQSTDTNVILHVIDMIDTADQYKIKFDTEIQRKLKNVPKNMYLNYIDAIIKTICIFN